MPAGAVASAAVNTVLIRANTPTEEGSAPAPKGFDWARAIALTVLVALLLLPVLIVLVFVQ